MRAKNLLPLMTAATVLAVSLASAAAGGGFDLVTAKEYSIELKDRTLPGAAFVPRAADLNAPTITVMTPNSHAPIQPPVDIDLRFTPAEGATVNAGSLKILYGFMHLDITERILQAPGVQVTAAGLTARGARLPSGSHKLTIEVRDNLGRAGRQVLEFVVQ